MAGRSDSTKVSAWTVATGAGATSVVVVVVVVDVVVVVESGAPPTSMTSCGFPAAASRALYRTPSAEGLSRAKQYTPSPRIVLVTSKSTAWPSATIPTVASTRPSMAGLVFQLTVRSFQLQLIGWMRPPTTLWEFGRLATWSRRRADATWRPATPLTRTRRNVSFTGLASSSSTALVPKLMAGLAELTDASASTTATGAAAGHTGAPPPHLPPEQVSPAVQALPSSHGAALAVWMQAPPAQLSSVQGLPSSQASPTPRHTPSRQESCWVHASPSSHEAALAVWRQPRRASQRSSVQGSSSSHRSRVPATQAKLTQVSSPLQAS